MCGGYRDFRVVGEREKVFWLFFSGFFCISRCCREFSFVYMCWFRFFRAFWFNVCIFVLVVVEEGLFLIGNYGRVFV